MKLLFISVECWTWHSTRKHQHDTNEIVCVCAKVSEGEEFIITNILLIPWACYMMQVSSFFPLIFLSHFAPICLLSLSSLPLLSLPRTLSIVSLCLSQTLFVPLFYLLFELKSLRLPTASCLSVANLSQPLSFFLSFWLSALHPILFSSPPPIPPSPCPLSCVTNNSNLNIKG